MKIQLASSPPPPPSSIAAITAAAASCSKERKMMSDDQKLWNRSRRAVSTALLSLRAWPFFNYTQKSPADQINMPPNNSSSSSSPSSPQQVHISVIGKDSMRITWITEDEKVPSLVEYGKVAGEYSMSATGERTFYRFLLIYTSGSIHHVEIGPLEPDTVYYYRCGGFQQDFSFKTPPSDLPIELAIVGDLGQWAGARATLERIGRSNYDILLLPGDLSYANGVPWMWDSFGRFVEPYASKRPWMVTEGNHEIESIPLVAAGGSFLAYNARWRMPYEESGSASNLYYSFDAAGGAVHVIMLGSYADYGPGSEQYRWLVGDLAKVDRAATPWVIVVLHAPWYNTNNEHQGDGEGMRRAMEPLLYEAKVDAVFAGHVHAYERFTRIYNNEADPLGPMYITIGSGGNVGQLTRFRNDHKSSSLSLFREASFGHGRLKIVSRSSAHWSWHPNEGGDGDGDGAGDEVWLQCLSSSGESSSTASPASSVGRDTHAPPATASPNASTSFLPVSPAGGAASTPFKS